MGDATENANGVESEPQVLQAVASALGAAFREFLSPELADRVSQVLAKELGLPHVSSLPRGKRPEDGNDDAPAQKGKRKRAVDPNRKPRLINSFNLFQAISTRMLKEKNYHDAENTRLLAVSASMWKKVDPDFKKHFEDSYAPLLKQWNDAKTSGVKFDVQAAVAEFEKDNQVPDHMQQALDELTSRAALDAANATAGGQADGDDHEGGYEEEGHDESGQAADEEVEPEEEPQPEPEPELEEEPEPEPEPEPKHKKERKKRGATSEKKKKKGKKEELEPAAADRDEGAQPDPEPPASEGRKKKKKKHTPIKEGQ